MNESFLLDNGQPDLGCLVNSFNRSAPNFPGGGIDWLDQVRDCAGPGDSPDGRKHSASDDPDDEAFPWEGASNCKPFTADDAINELGARDLAAFWRAMIQRGAGTTDEGAYAVALVEHLVFGPMMAKLDKEVELSSQFRHGRGWCILAPRWVTEFGMKRYELKLDVLRQMAAEAQQALQKLAQDPNAAAQIPPEAIARLQQASQAIVLVMDPTLADQAVDFLRELYDRYVAENLPKELLPRVPKLADKRLRKALVDLREKEVAAVPVPYLCRDEPEITALEPWREVCLPTELTDTNEIVFHLEYVSPTTLEARILNEEYDPKWVEEAKKLKTSFTMAQLPTRNKPQGLTVLGQAGPVPTQDLSGGERGLVCIIHAVYKALDEDGIPAAFCTTFHKDVKGTDKNKPLIAKHEMVDTLNGDLLYVDLVFEWRARSVTSSRSVTEMVATQQKLIKDTLDQIIDRGSITILPPINVYESPTGARYQFGPGAQNYVRQGKEPQFMQTPSGQGMTDGVEVYREVKKSVDNRFGLMSEDVPATRMQTLQEKNVRRFLIAWTRAFQMVLALYQKHGKDEQFAKITGAPEGWLEEHRNTPGALTALLDFDVRELDSELFIEQVKAMDATVLPMDTMNVIDRAKYTAWKSRGIVGPRTARSFLRPMADATTALREKAELQVLKMFAGTPPIPLDKTDPSAAGLLEMTQETVLSNPKFVAALTPEALQAVAGEQANTVMLNMRQSGLEPKPDPLFSTLLMKWVENLTFLGVTQQRNKQIGRQGVDMGGEEG
jgi:hypothetical protein